MSWAYKGGILSSEGLGLGSVWFGCAITEGRRPGGGGEGGEADLGRLDR